jgi:methyl-accepting chemotaxis protein
MRRAARYYAFSPIGLRARGVLKSTNSQPNNETFGLEISALRSVMKLTIKNAVILASVLVGLGFAAAVGVNGVALGELRVGGPVYDDLKRDMDLLADVLPPPEYVIEPYLEATLAVNDFDHAQVHRARIDALRKAYEDRKSYWKTQPIDTRAALDDATAKADLFWQEMDASFLPALARGDKDGALRSYVVLSSTYAEHRAAVDRLVEAGNKSLADSQVEADRANGFYRLATWLISALVLAVLAAVLYGLVKLVIRPLLRFAEVTDALAHGNLNTEIPARDRSDELGILAQSMALFRDKLLAAEKQTTDQTALIADSIGAGLERLAKGDLRHRIAADLTGVFGKLKDDFNASVAHLGQTMRQITESSAQIANGAGEISQAADDLSRRTEKQAAELEETNAALEQITATVKKTAANAREASQSVGDAKAAADDGGRVVATAVQAMDTIAQSSKQITDIIGVIDEIAFQTNLLALNAGVEAARAGDAGKGFAVVATEVRALAGRSGEAAKQIKALIKTSSEQVGDGVKCVGETGAALKRIIDQVERINRLVVEMAEGAEQQSVGIEQVNTAIGQMDQVTQQNAAMVEQSTAASRNLADETKRLSDLVGFFTVAGGAVARPDASRAKPQSRVPVRPRVVAKAVGDDWQEF